MPEEDNRMIGPTHARVFHCTGNVLALRDSKRSRIPGRTAVASKIDHQARVTEIMKCLGLLQQTGFAIGIPMKHQDESLGLGAWEIPSFQVPAIFNPKSVR